MSGTVVRIIGYIVTGLAAGVLGGLLGIGGGAVMVPSLNLALGEAMQISIAASLVSMVFISASSAYGHWKNRYILKNVVIRMVPPATVCAVGGAVAGTHFPKWVLQTIFAVFLLYTAFDMVLKVIRRRLKNSKDEDPVREFKVPNEWTIPLIAVPMGFSCGVLGIGGGILAVPALHFFLRLPFKNAIANSSATIFFSSIVAAVAKLISIHGLAVKSAGGAEMILTWQHAFVIGLIMAPTAFIGGRIGSYLTKVSPTAVIRVVFAGVALWAGYKFYVQATSTDAAPSEPPAVESIAPGETLESPPLPPS